jgi:alkyldihydroxyacetonephosphate synthase
MHAFITDLTAMRPQLVVSTDPAEIQRHARDRWPEAAKWTAEEAERHAPAAVVRATSTADVSATLATATQHNVTVIPYGAGSGVVGGVVGEGAFVSLDLSGLTSTPLFDDELGQVTVPAGVVGADLERMLNERGRRLPHYPQSLPLASIGGLVATRSSGTFSSKYGNIEDLLVSLEVVLADGSVITTKTSPRSSTGPSLAQLFVGSEGTLGVITAVTLRTFPLPAARAFRGVAFTSLGAGIAAIRSILDGGITPAVIRLYDPAEAEHIFVKSDLEPGRVLLVLGFDGHPQVVDAEQAAALELTARVEGEDLGATPGETWERTRFDAGWLDRGNAGQHTYADAIEVSASWPQLEALHTRVLDQLAPHVDTAYAHYSHFYPNGGAIYFIFFTSGPDADAARGRYRAAWDATLRTVVEHGGSISHHHGVGEARKDWMAMEHSDSLRVLAALKQALDPQGLLAPGKLGVLALHEEVAR